MKRQTKTRVPLLSLLLCHAVSSLSPENTSPNPMGNFLRERRHLVFPDPKESETKVQVLFGLGLPMEGEVSMTLGYVLKCNYNLPYNASDFTYARFPEDYMSRKERSNEGRPSRWTLYKILESAMERLGSGRACLLRAVCESAGNPFDEGGLLGRLLHIFFTPSATPEEYEIYSDREYHAAEIIGRNSHGAVCKSLYRECEDSPLDYFTVLV